MGDKSDIKPDKSNNIFPVPFEFAQADDIFIFLPKLF
jgi:hypothetical protein